MSISQREPVRPGGQMHLKAAISSMQVAPFLHGTDAHSSMSVLQSLPEDKILHQENKGGRN